MVLIGSNPILDPPCPRVGITVEGLGAGEHSITVWRLGDPNRTPVRGSRRVQVVDSYYIEDYEAPLGRPVTYELEILSGTDSGTARLRTTTTLEAPSGYLQDPLNPALSVPIHSVPRNGEIFLAPATFSKMTYAAQSSLFNIMGSDRPVGISGPRQAASGIPLSLVVEAEEENVRLRNLVMSSPHIIVRPLPAWGHSIPATATYAAASFEETPPRHAGRGVTRWETTGDTIRGSSARVLVSLYTYQDVAAIFATYDSKQAIAQGTYLDDQKNPLGDTGV